jgi:quercetin dioxygenase-like cupin family protein
MATESEPPGLTFLGRPLPDRFELRVVTIAPGCERPYDEAEWRDAIVVVESGAVDLDAPSGASRRFEQGAALWLVGWRLRALCNRGSVPAVLSAVSRR